MFLNLSDSSREMKLVYSFSEELRKDSKRLQRAQSLSLDLSTQYGLSAKHGLFGSEEWWENIRTGEIPLIKVKGTIVRVYVAGPDSVPSNSINVQLDNNFIVPEGIYCNLKRDVKLFQIQRKVSYAFVLTEMKKQPAPDGGVDYARTMLEMAVSLA